MTFNVEHPLDQLFNNIFAPYRNGTPDVDLIVNAMVEKGMVEDENSIVNDHVAFRTLGVSNLGIASLEKIFLHHGYTKKDHYYFEKKQLNAFWYAPPSEKYPRIFISELIIDSLSEENQKIIKKYTKNITSDPVDAIDLDDVSAITNFFAQPLWDLPTLAEFNSLAEDSEYASWVIYNRYYLNHFTISIHDLKNGFDDIETFNTFIEKLGIALNQSGGVVKVSKDGLLRQSSTMAKKHKVTFACGLEKEISGSYVEFAQRGVLKAFKDLPREHIRRAHRVEGFAAANADRIFESTYTK